MVRILCKEFFDSARNCSGFHHLISINSYLSTILIVNFMAITEKNDLIKTTSLALFIWSRSGGRAGSHTPTRSSLVLGMRTVPRPSGAQGPRMRCLGKGGVQEKHVSVGTKRLRAIKL